MVETQRFGSVTTTLPSVISLTAGATGIDTGLVTAAAPTSYTTLSVTRLSFVTEDGTISTTKFVTPSVVTDPAQYSSLSAVAAASSLSLRTQTSSSRKATSTASTASASSKSSSNLGTIIPAVVVPVAIILIATLVAFWFFMRRRHRRDLNNQPAFIIAAKTEKLTSTTNSLASDYQDHGPPIARHPAAPIISHNTEKPLPSTRTRAVSPRPSSSSSGSPPNFLRTNLGVTRTSNVREEQRPSPLLPPIRTDSSLADSRPVASFATSTSPTSNYSPQTSRSANPHLGPQTPHNSFIPGAKKTSGRGPPAGVGTSHHVLTRNRSQSLTSPGGADSNRSNPYLNNESSNARSQLQRPPTAPTSGFRGPQPLRGFSPAGQQLRSFSPTGNRAPPPPPIKASALQGSGAFINQPQYSPIVRDMPKAKRPSVIVPPTESRGISYGSHTSPLLPSPQSDNRRDHDLTAENLRIARLANSSRLGFGSPIPDNVSDISAPDEAEEDAKSDVSSLNELEKFNFERDTRGSRSGSALGSLPGGRSGSAMNNYSPVLGSGHESPWR